MKRACYSSLHLLRSPLSSSLHRPTSMLRRLYSTATGASSSSSPSSPPPSTPTTPAAEETTHFGFTDVPREQKESLVGEVFRKVAGNYGILTLLFILLLFSSFFFDIAYI